MITDEDYETCPGCGLVLLAGQGSRHPYFGATASCYHIFLEILAREYGDPAYMAMHRVTVDAYAAQHPGEPGPRSIQSVNVHLVGLYLVLERRLQPTFVQSVIGSLTRRKNALHWLAPPARLGQVTVVDVLSVKSPINYAHAVRAWGLSVWAAWKPHHETIVALAAKAAADFS
jgi:Family of unknown function (DUF5946)